MLKSREATLQYSCSYVYSYSYVPSVLRSGLTLDNHFPSNASVNCTVYSYTPTIPESRILGSLPEKLWL